MTDSIKIDLPTSDWGKLKPETVSSLINFDLSNPDWQYDTDDHASMASKQAEGVAYLWNLLSMHGTALLADEVGMGKTFQALGVASLLWRMKPHARVLVMAPNKDICLHWRREFDSLVKDHYREADNSVKNIVDGGPVPAIELCFKLDELASAVERQSGHLFFTTIHSLSGLLRGKEITSDPAVEAGKIAGTIHDRLREALGPSGFDLIIVDEAHYLRNINGGSQRVSAAGAFFGQEGKRLSERNLLLTATPSHTRLTDVESILGFFTTTNSSPDNDSATDAVRAQQLLNKFAVRRLRMMKGKDQQYKDVLYSKHHYRNESGTPTSFDGRPNAEMFFALYQKRLVADLKKKTENKSLMYGYLEGFESFGQGTSSAEDLAEGLEGASQDKGREDWSNASDSDLLKYLSKQYSEIFGEFPDHPKYGQLISQCVPGDIYEPNRSIQEDKHLIFVRRIPSVKEITQRINKQYDDQLATMIYQAWGQKAEDHAVEIWRKQAWSRDGLTQFINQCGYQEEIEQEELRDEDDNPQEEDSYLASRIAELFVVKKGRGGQTDCANVRLRFSKPKSIFSLFLEPASDYLMAGYDYFYPGTSDSKGASYSDAATHTRFTSWKNKSALRTATKNSPQPTGNFDRKLYTVWTLLVPELPKHLQDKLETWSQNHKPIAENFSHYIQAGFLFASPVMVELYSWFVEFRRTRSDKNAQSWYSGFYEFVRPLVKTSLMLRYFIAALESFDQLCGKIIDHGLEEWGNDWKPLKRLTSPCWYASGENSDSRQRLILGFNSPFYPNLLVSTSVLQEGVNLHMQCYQVHHYGIAGSPGDNEQRVGRLDRLFGCVNKRLLSDEQKTLDIYFPYLMNSVDEDQVASFVERKHRIEEQMDRCLQGQFDKEVQISTNTDWKQFLRKPIAHNNLPYKNPYEPSHVFGDSEQVTYTPCTTHTVKDISQRLEGIFKEIIDPNEEVLEKICSEDSQGNSLFLVDPLMKLADSIRKQPIFVNLSFSPEFSALVPETAYILTLESPISNKANLDQLFHTTGDCEANIRAIIHSLQSRYPMARAAINENAEKSYFYLNARVDLPLFVHHDHFKMLSSQEIKLSFEHLKAFADSFERALFADKQDLQLQTVLQGETATIKPVNLRRQDQFNGPDTLTWKNSGYMTSISQSIPLASIAKGLNTLGIHKIEGSELMGSLQLQQHIPFVHFSTAHDAATQSLPYPREHLDNKERELLEQWFRHVKALCRSREVNGLTT